MTGMRFEHTRSGLGPVVVREVPQPFRLSIAWYAPMPAWIKQPDPEKPKFYRFANRIDWQRYLDHRAGA